MTARLKLYDDDKEKRMIEALTAGAMANMMSALPQPTAKVPHVPPRATRPTVRQ